MCSVEEHAIGEYCRILLCTKSRCVPGAVDSGEGFGPTKAKEEKSSVEAKHTLLSVTSDENTAIF